MKRMSGSQKIKLLIPLVIILFFASYAWHKHVSNESIITGRLQSNEMDEISGIAASGINPNLFYVHNDSGDISRFFSITADGALKTMIYFKGDSTEQYGVHDCEDIAVGPGPDKGKSYVYLGDIGDNYSIRRYITVYRMEEKKAWATGGRLTTEAVPLHLRYPDGPKDAETLMVDPIEKLIYIVTKRHDFVGVYTAPLDYKANDTLVLTKRCKLFFAGYKPLKWISAGDISKDGQQVVVKSYAKVYYWKRADNEPIWKTLLKKPEELTYEQEKQGEAIGFTADGKGYYTTSEGVYSPIYYYPSPEK